MQSKTCSAQVQDRVRPYSLLLHPFYQAWMKGQLSIEQLRTYAINYFPHVRIFPRLVSAVHSQCEDPQARKILLENLADEEGFQNGIPHPELWEQFGKGLGVEDIRVHEAGPKGKALAEIFFNLCRSSYAEGLGALYAYEQQIPEIARLKIQGLKENYQICDPSTLAFFEVHQSADQFHSEAIAELLNRLSPKEQEMAFAAAETAAKALWDFLTESYGTSEPMAC